MNVTKPVVIRCALLFPGQPKSLLGAYLREYDPEAAGGRGSHSWSHDITEAMVFPSLAEAHALWTAVPVCHPVRDDGELNRPLTAFSITFEDAP
jgi:hypothetical protein